MNNGQETNTDDGHTSLPQAGTLACSHEHEEAVGFAMEDLVVAQRAYQKATQEGKG
jgi:hypothetical protein